MRARDKVKNAEDVARICHTLRGERMVRVVFTNGCFDLLHLGHLRYLEEARALGDLLVVGVNSDASVREIKGALRPIQGENERSELVAGFYCVNYVVVFDTPDPLPIIEIIRPDILVKGADWPEDQIVGAEAVKRTGGRVERIPLTPERSTTSIVEKVMDRYGRNHEDHSC